MSLRNTAYLLRTAALLAPFVICGVPGQNPRPAYAQAEPSAEMRVHRVAPGDAVMSIAPAGMWTFGARGGRLLLEKGGTAVYTTDGEGNLVELLNTAGGTKSLLPAGGVNMVQEGAPGGMRYPSTRADDDNDGKIDEDPLDRADNDRDGKIDEDFAAIGDAMAVVKYGSAAGGAITVRQEVYAWSLPHIDRMVASTLVIRNAGLVVLPGVRVGVTLVPGDAIADNRLLARNKQSMSGEYATASVMLRGRDESLAVLLFAHVEGDMAEWDIRDNGESVVAVSPRLADLAPGQVAVVHLALVAGSADETLATRAVQAARRTVLGDGSARMIPPPVSVNSHTQDLAPASDDIPVSSNGTPAVDAFWLKAGKLDEILLTGSPNPFRDAISIDYEIPSRVIDEDGVEHTLSGAAVATSVKVYNVTGRLIATLVESTEGPGRYRTGWTAQTDDGGSVASGVYYVKLTIGKRSVTKRLVQLK
jgi:hypothetical protein